jgi:protease-4
MMEEVNTVTPEVTPSSAPKKRGNGCLWITLIVAILMCVGLVCGVGSIILLFASSSSSSSALDESIVREGGEKKAAIIHINGVITGSTQQTPFSSSTVAEPARVKADLDRAINDPNVEVIILNIESPGGEVVASDMIYNYVLEARTKKPVIAYSGTMAASGGYYIASAADEFMTHPDVLTGSIGVIMQAQRIEGLYEKVGIDTVTITSGPYKSNENLFDPESNGELKNIYQEIVDQSYESFITAIANGRNMDIEEVRKLGDGRIYTGDQALSNGLVDRVGYYEDLYELADDKAEYNNLTIVEYNHTDFFGSLFSLQNIFKQKIPTEQYGYSLYYIVSY